mmetsp:Transcript_25463/g.47421  ORF Transcript_25463/g.47421 Transcript_25463/m.47421 type:complete len:709 (-) Transcript_25463:429-2555(-)
MQLISEQRATNNGDQRRDERDRPRGPAASQSLRRATRPTILTVRLDIENASVQRIELDRPVVARELRVDHGAPAPLTVPAPVARLVRQFVARIEQLAVESGARPGPQKVPVRKVVRDELAHLLAVAVVRAHGEFGVVAEEAVVERGNHDRILHLSIVVELIHVVEPPQVVAVRVHHLHLAQREGLVGSPAVAGVGTEVHGPIPSVFHPTAFQERTRPPRVDPTGRSRIVLEGVVGPEYERPLHVLPRHVRARPGPNNVGTVAPILGRLGRRRRARTRAGTSGREGDGRTLGLVSDGHSAAEDDAVRGAARAGKVVVRAGIVPLELTESVVDAEVSSDFGVLSRELGTVRKVELHPLALVKVVPLRRPHDHVRSLVLPLHEPSGFRHHLHTGDPVPEPLRVLLERVRTDRDERLERHGQRAAVQLAFALVEFLPGPPDYRSPERVRYVRGRPVQKVPEAKVRLEVHLRLSVVHVQERPGAVPVQDVRRIGNVRIVLLVSAKDRPVLGAARLPVEVHARIVLRVVGRSVVGRKERTQDHVPRDERPRNARVLVVDEVHLELLAVEELIRRFRCHGRRSAVVRHVRFRPTHDSSHVVARSDARERPPGPTGVSGRIGPVGVARRVGEFEETIHERRYDVAGRTVLEPVGRQVGAPDSRLVGAERVDESVLRKAGREGEAGGVGLHVGVRAVPFDVGQFHDCDWGWILGLCW